MDKRAISAHDRLAENGHTEQTTFRMRAYMGASARSLAYKGRALAFAASTMAAVTAPALAGEFSQKECKGIAAIAGAVVRHVGKDTLSDEFRQSFVDWMGADFRCNGPKEIALVTDNDAATYRTIRSELLQLPKSIDLKKAGLTPVVKFSTIAPVSDTLGDNVISTATLETYVKEYAGSYLFQDTIRLFAEIGLKRLIYDRYRKQGFSQEDIEDAARTVKALDWKNDFQAFDDIQRSTKAERAALIEIDREKDPVKQKLLIEKKSKEFGFKPRPR